MCVEPGSWRVAKREKRGAPSYYIPWLFWGSMMSDGHGAVSDWLPQFVWVDWNLLDYASYFLMEFSSGKI